MEQIVLNILEVVQKSLNSGDYQVGKREIDPRALYTIRTESIALCIGIITLLRYRDAGKVELNGSISEDIENFLDSYPWNDALLGKFSGMDSSEKHKIENWYSELFSQNFKDCELSNVYEALLSYEWIFDKDGFHLTWGKSGRNRSGSYYTPQHLADTSLRKLMDQVISEKLGISGFSFNSQFYYKRLPEIADLLSSLKIIDLSCGTGHFLKAVLVYIKQFVLPFYTGPLEEKEQLLCSIMKNIWGVDIDYIALLIAKNELELLADIPKSRDLESNQFIHGNPLIPPLASKVDGVEKRKLAAEGLIYHPSLGIDWSEFNESQDGFDLIIGNPPWEKIRFEEKSFFKPWAPHISSLNKKDERANEIKRLRHTQPLIYDYYQKFLSSLEESKQLIQDYGMFKYSATGELNTYALFTELATSLIKNDGRVCYIVKSALVVSPVNERFFRNLISQNLIISCFDFINRRNIFAIDNRERFSVLILGSHQNCSFNFVAGLTDPEEILTVEALNITQETLRLINPLTGMLPSITDSEELAFLLKMHSLHPVFENVFSECKFGRLVHYTNHAEFIDNQAADDNIPVYEGKFIDIYDGRYSTYEGLAPQEVYGGKASSVVIPEERKQDPYYLPASRYFIKKHKWASLTKNYTEPYSLMWRSLTSASNRRTCIATILPHIPASQSIQFLQLKDAKKLTILLALINSVVFDYMVRLKLNGIDLTQKILKQVAVPRLESFYQQLYFEGVNASIYDHIAVRVASLIGDDERMSSFVKEIKPSDYPVYTFNGRKPTISEIDRLVALAYMVDDVELEKIAQSFPGFYSKEEINIFFSINEKDHASK